MKIRIKKVKYPGTNIFIQNPEKKPVDNFFDFFNSTDTQAAIADLLNPVPEQNPELKGKEKSFSVRPDAIGFSRYEGSDNIAELFILGYKGFVPVAVYGPADFSSAAVENDMASLSLSCEGKDSVLPEALTDGIELICRAQFEKDKPTQLGISEKTGRLFKKIKNIFIKKACKLKLNYNPFILMDEKNTGFLLVPYKLDMTLFGRHVSDYKIIKSVKCLVGDKEFIEKAPLDEGVINGVGATKEGKGTKKAVIKDFNYSLIGENYIKDIYNFSLLMTCLGMYDEIDNKPQFFDNPEYFDTNKHTLLPTVLDYMNNSPSIRIVVSKAVCSGAVFAYDCGCREKAVREFIRDITGERQIEDKNVSFWTEMFNPYLRITVGSNGASDIEIPMSEFLSNEDGYLLGSNQDKEENGNPLIFIPGTQRVHGVLFYDESVDTLIYRRTTVALRNGCEEKTTRDDYEIYDGAIVYIGDTPVKFSYFAKKE